jgi:hypothetical protein
MTRPSGRVRSRRISFPIAADVVIFRRQSWEGQIVLKYRGSDYEGGQTLFEHSALLSRGDEVPGSGYDEWMRVSCPGGTQGWLLMRDIADAPGFGPPNIIGYGRAADRSANIR